MEAVSPTWVTKEFLEDVLRNGSEKAIEVVVNDFGVQNAIPKGNNYICDILRVNINYTSSEEGTESRQQKAKSLILKVPKTGGMCDVIMEMGVIQREIDIYNVLIPRLGDIYGANVFTAKSYKCSEKNVLVLDDLNSIGYKMADRRKQLGYEESRVALKALARFHGASVKCHETDPEYTESFTELIFCEKFYKEQADFILGFFNLAAEEISQLPDCSGYLEKLHVCRDKAWDILLDLFAPKKSNFNVLNHGDAWVTNMLFKYDEDEKPIDVKLLDLQIAKYGSPAADLAYFFTSSVQEETRKTRFEDLISEYLRELNATLELVGVERRLELDQLKAEIKQFHFYELFVAINLLPTVLCNPEEAVDMKDVSEEDMKNFAEQGTFRNNFKTELYRRIIPKLMADFEEKGLF